MGPQQLDLKDIHLPDAIGWWPPALGWWLLAILIPLSGFFIFWLYKKITQKTALKTAKKMLANIKQDTALNDFNKLLKLSELLRRVAISVSPRAETASLTGENWLKYLDSTLSGSRFTSGPGQCLAEAQYQKKTMTKVDIHLLISLCEDWLKAQKQNKK